MEESAGQKRTQWQILLFLILLGVIWSHVHCISSQPSQSVSNKWTKPTQTRTHRLQKTLSIVCFPVRRKTIHLPILIDCQSYSSMWKHLPASVDVRGGYKLWKFSSVCHHGENWPNGDWNVNDSLNFGFTEDVFTRFWFSDGCGDPLWCAICHLQTSLHHPVAFCGHRLT